MCIFFSFLDILEFPVYTCGSRSLFLPLFGEIIFFKAFCLYEYTIRKAFVIDTLMDSKKRALTKDRVKIRYTSGDGTKLNEKKMLFYIKRREYVIDG